VPLRDVVALDGPSGTGKSTVARALAVELGLRYLNTGAMYRAVTWAVLRDGVDPDDQARVGRVAAGARIEIGTDPGHEEISLDGVSVVDRVRSAEVTAAVSAVSAVPEVRRLLVARQRELIGAGGIVVEGRDIGTVVAPDAPLKVYLTASHDARVRRRVAQEGDLGGLGAASAELLRRDRYDSSRALDPLRAADDAVQFDTTTLQIDDVVKRLVDIARDRGIAVATAPVGRAADLR
jgi:CMP/dCMP kinase